MPTHIGAVIPTPIPVAVAGSVRLVAPLRLRDVAEMQTWLSCRIPCPLAAALADLEGLEGKYRNRRLSAAYEALEAWPPRYGSPEAEAEFSKLDGLAFFLAIVGRRSGWTAEDLADVLAGIRPAEYAALCLAAFGSDPLDECGRLMGIYQPEAEDGRRSEDLNWAEAFADVADATGWTFDQIADLTLSQWTAYRTRGKSGRDPITPPGLDTDELSRFRHMLFYGLDESDMTTEGAADAGP
jgi:hypothetical protein